MDDDGDREDEGYADGSGQFVRRKATIRNDRGRTPSFEELESREYSREATKLFRELEQRFPSGCMIQLNDQRIRIINVVTARDSRSRVVVRYHVSGVHTASGAPRVHRMAATAFLRMVKDAKPE